MSTEATWEAIDCPLLAIVGPHHVCRHELDRNPAGAHLIRSPKICAKCLIRGEPCANPRPLPTEAEIEAAIKSREPAQSMPSLLTRAKNFGGALAGFAADGFSLAGGALKRQRLEICRACDQYRNGSCLKCGCLLAAKAAIRNEKCPLGKWEEVKSEKRKVKSDAQASSAAALSTFHSSLFTSSVTFGITAFERPAHLERLVASILQFYPDARIVVADNGRQKAHLPACVKVLDVPYDCGLSAARNALIDQLQTPYLLYMDDDYLFTERTQIERFLDVLDHHPEVGLVCGAWESRQDRSTPGVFKAYALDQHAFRRVLHETKSTGLVRVTGNGVPYQLVDKGHNFGLARREFFADHRWNESLKMGEHAEFFWRVKQAQKWRVASCPSVAVIHDVSDRDTYYETMRARAAGFHRAWYEASGFTAHRAQRQLHNFTAVPEKPNLIVFGIGHARTTIVTQMLGALGWSLAGAVHDPWSEHVKIRDVNDMLLINGRPFDQGAAKREVGQLNALAAAWAVKDPRFVLTLDRWLPAIAELERPPALLWVDRGLDELAESYQRRQEIDAQGNLTLPYQRGHTLASIHAEAARQFDLYPWPKLRITGEQFTAAMALFKPPPAVEMLVIPRIFHRIWLGGRPMPDEFARFGRGWVQMNPGWELRDWDEAAIERLGPLETGDLWQRTKNFAMASDVLRYELLNRFGGVYLDTDFEALQPLEPALGAMSFVGAGERAEMVSTGFIAAIAHHPILRDVLALLPQRVALNWNQAQATGPGMLTQVWRRYRREPGVRTYAPSYFYPYGWKEKHRRWDKFPGALAVHHWAGSWT